MSSLENLLVDEEIQVLSKTETNPKKPGWKAMPYILGNETVERLANFGIQTNFMVYLLRQYNMDQVLAANILNTWAAISNVLPIIGGFVSDAYLGKFLTIAIASFASFTV
ncbi:putative proton-dependent oligopeptide transporter family [Lupinus albus]|uniref:Putative proton-dependent oligopeptide transporter family n=1 Tax=Lupinus albus TaxID=3870 RepID=A0A6A4P888_LUPAL|nr:putative proton-dependent oligopeptide transporter family [Lupinus albus]